MTSLEIEKKLDNLSAEFVYNEGIVNILLLALSISNRRKEEKVNLSIPQELIDLRLAADRIIIDLEALLEEADRSKSIDKVTEIQNKLIELYKNIYFYKLDWGVLSMAVNDETFLRKYKDNPPVKGRVQYDLFYRDCQEFLISAKDIFELRVFTAQLLKCMPMRMSRPKFFDIVAKSLIADFDGSSEDIILKNLEIMKHSCAPALHSDYGKAFPEIAQWLLEKSEINPARLDDDQLSTEYEDFGIMIDTIEEIDSCFSEVYEDLNSILILLYLSYTFDELTVDCASYADLFHAAVEIMSGETERKDAEVIMETLIEQLESAISPLIDKTGELNKEVGELMENVAAPLSLSEDIQKGLQTQSFICGIYYKTIDSEIYNFDISADSPVASKEFCKTVVNEFIEYISEYYSTLPMQLRKSKMLALLGSIPVVWDISDTMEYVKSSIENCIGEEQKILILDKAGYVFTSNGMEFEENLDEHEHHGHDHCCCHEHEHHH
ncbi:hypothetical protein IMSAG049_00201 [Clostridiales bacterium]|nr:hypothetical protein IMSAG049_00201 [Clostridiales bacterium]